jgi:betaine lipid synthase
VSGGLESEANVCVHRVNMYASTWICTKEVGLEGEVKRGRKTSLAELRLEGPAMRME